MLFRSEVLIYDDASTDTTADIIQEYADKYPDIVKPLFEKENQFSRGENVSKKYNWPRVQGEYVALCEGDDYWTDENKLQKQVDFLDSHPDCSLCFHPVRIVDQSNPAREEIYPDQKLLQRAGELNFASLLKRNFIQTNSVVYRWRFHKESYNLMPEHILPGDWFLHLLHAQVGKIGFLPEVMVNGNVCCAEISPKTTKVYDNLAEDAMGNWCEVCFLKTQSCTVYQTNNRCSHLHSHRVDVADLLCMHLTH